MSRFVKFFVCAFAVVAIAGVAQAAGVTLHLDTYGPLNLDGRAPDSWVLSATADGESDGIAGYNIDFVNSATAIAGGPHAFNLDNFKLMGFTVDNTDFVGDGALFAGQNSTDAATLIYGIGQEAGTLGNIVPDSQNASDGTPTVPWDVPVVLGWGTGPWETVDIAVSANVNVWSLGQAAVGGTNAEAAAVDLVVTRNNIPEPASFALLGIALLGVVGLRRKLG